jgi:hypothetical protein
MSADDYKEAIDSGDIEAIRELITFKVPMNELMTNEISPLFYAVLKRQYDIAKTMIIEGADIFMDTGNDGSIVKLVLKDRALGDKDFQEFLKGRLGTSYFKQFAATGADREATIARAAEVYAERGPICDTEGYYQHFGECWNDFPQMAITFADRIRQYTQPMLLSKAELVPRGNASLTTYVDSLRHRFARHYLNEVDRRRTCVAIGTRRAGGLNAMTAAVAAGQNTGIPREYVSRTEYKAGDTPVKAFKLLLQIFSLQDKFTFGIHADTYTPPYNTTAVLAFLYKPLKGGSNHINGFYTCGGIDYLYDNNSGVFQYPWHAMLYAKSKMSKNAMWVGKTHPGFYAQSYPAIVDPDTDTMTYFDLRDGKMHAAWLDATLMNISEEVIVYTIEDNTQGVSPKPEEAPAIVGRTGLPLRAFNVVAPPHLNVEEPVEEMPGLAAAIPAPFLLPRRQPKPFLLPKRTQNTRPAAVSHTGGRRLRQSRKAIRKRAKAVALRHTIKR